MIPKKTKVDNIFDNVPRELIIHIFKKMDNDDRLDWFRKYRNWGLTCKANYDMFKSIGIDALPEVLVYYLPKLTTFFRYGMDMEIKTKLTRNGSYFDAQLTIACIGEYMCSFCKTTSYHNYNFGLCTDCHERRSMKTTHYCHLMKIDSYSHVYYDIGLATARILCQKLFNEDIDTRCMRLWGMPFDKCRYDITFDNGRP